MTLHLRCIRCGEWDEMDPTAVVGWGLCSRCTQRDPLVSGRKPWHLFSRWTKSMYRHPTYKALSAALDRLQSVEPGTLDPACPPNEEPSLRSPVT